MNNLEWWWELINKDENWITMPPSMREKLIFRFQQIISQLAKINVGKEDIKELLNDTGDATVVFDAILSSWAWPENWKDNKYKYMNNLKREILAKFVYVRDPKKQWHSEKEKTPKTTKPPVSLELVEKYNPLKFTNDVIVNKRGRPKKK